MNQNRPPNEPFEQRLTRLEQENQQIKRTGFVLLAVSLALILMGQATPTTPARAIEAEKFVVRDRSGRERAVLGMEDNAFPSLRLREKDGRVAAGLLAPERGPRLYLSDKYGRHTSLGQVGGPGVTYASLSLSDGSGKRAALTLGPEFPSLRLEDKERGVSIGLQEKWVYLWLHDKNGKQRASLEVWEDSPRLTLRDANETTRATLGSTSLERTQTGLVENLPPSSLVLFDKDGKVIFRAP